MPATLAAVLVVLLLAGAALAVHAGRQRWRLLAEMRCHRCGGVSHHPVDGFGRPVRPVRCPACGSSPGF